MKKLCIAFGIIAIVGCSSSPKTSTRTPSATDDPHEANTKISSEDQVFIERVRQCLEVAIDRTRLDAALSSGLTAGEAFDKARIVEGFDRKLYDKMRERGVSDEDAMRRATVSKYVNNSQDCRHIRKVITDRGELLKGPRGNDKPSVVGIDSLEPRKDN